MDVHVGKASLSRVVDALGVFIDGKGALSDVERRRVEVKAPRIIARMSKRWSYSFSFLFLSFWVLT